MFDIDERHLDGFGEFSLRGVGSSSRLGRVSLRRRPCRRYDTSATRVPELPVDWGALVVLVRETTVVSALAEARGLRSRGSTLEAMGPSKGLGSRLAAEGVRKHGLGDVIGRESPRPTGEVSAALTGVPVCRGGVQTSFVDHPRWLGAVTQAHRPTAI